VTRGFDPSTPPTFASVLRAFASSRLTPSSGSNLRASVPPCELFRCLSQLIAQRLTRAECRSPPSCRHPGAFGAGKYGASTLCPTTSRSNLADHMPVNGF